MTDPYQAWKDARRRVTPPQDFAGRVMAALATSHVRATRPRPLLLRLALGAIGACALLARVVQTLALFAT
jgi:hypothetical protein